MLRYPVRNVRLANDGEDTVLNDGIRAYLLCCVVDGMDEGIEILDKGIRPAILDNTVEQVVADCRRSSDDRCKES